MKRTTAWNEANCSSRKKRPCACCCKCFSQGFSLTRFSHQVPFSRNLCLYRLSSHKVFLSPGSLTRFPFQGISVYIGYHLKRFFPKATAKGSFEKRTTIKDYRSDGCLKRLSSKIAEVMAVFKDYLIKDCRSDGCLERLSSKAAEVITVLKDSHQRLPK